MALSQPKPKKKYKLKLPQPLPLSHKFHGIFNGFNVTIDGVDEMKKIVEMGYFGKANLSRNYPEFHKEIIRKRVFLQRKALNSCGKVKKVVVVPDSDSDDDYFNELQPEFQLDPSGIQESVHLNLEEAFFLMSAIKCLSIKYEDRILAPEEAWNLFKQTDTNFIVNYFVYYYFRAKNWVVKPGIKFGGDFLLYKVGPPFYHASYVVIINVVDENLQVLQNCKRRSMKNMCLVGLNRLCETAGKELLICEVICSSPIEQLTHEDSSKISIREIIMKRWFSKEN